MQPEVIQMCNPTYNQTLDMQIAKQCAPLLTGIKISNVLITSAVNCEKVYEMFKDTTVMIKSIYFDGEKITLLLYQPEQLMVTLQQSEVKLFMQENGYRSLETEEVLDCFSARFAAYMKHRSPFPHEMGILLGYPISDVIGFMKNSGKNFLYSGYWKVYSNLQEAQKTFHMYKQAKATVSGLVALGLSIRGILQVYRQEGPEQSREQLAVV